MTARTDPRVFPVAAGAGDYDVVVEVGGLSRLPALLAERVGAHRYAVISDHRVAALHGTSVAEGLRAGGLDARLFEFPAGEANKNRTWWTRLTDELLEGGFGRDSAVVAVGGGVTTDLGGFIAATFMRGVPVVQVPTSYLAMIDASVGGKTGVDVAHGKNLVGAFHAPALVLADPAVLKTLPLVERVQGLVEAFKHGAVMDAPYFDALVARLGALLGAESEAAAEAVSRSVELKAHVVAEDEREAGLRQILNFGHTLGHALEAASDYRVAHGTAVAAGMLLEAELGERLGVTAAGTRRRIEEGLGGLGLPSLPALDIDRVLSYLSADKKTRGGRPRYVLLRELGTADPADGWSQEADPELVRRILEDRLF